MKKISNIILVLLSACIALTDNTIKNKIEKLPDDYEGKDVLKGNAVIVKYHNKGFACDFLEDKQELVKNVSVFVLGIMFAGTVRDFFIKETDNLKKLADAFIIGGALSNTFDRIHKKYVTDYFKIKKTGIIYNLSDFSLFLGAFLMLVSSVASLFNMSNSTESCDK